MAHPQDDFHPERPLVMLSDRDPWRIRDACEGTQIFGATGSGKTSGSGQEIAKAFLRNGFGGLVLTAKPDECALWEYYAQVTGRTDSLIIFSPTARPGKDLYQFNFLQYEYARPGIGAGLTENLVNLFFTIIEVSERKAGATGGDPYWTRAAKQLLRNAIDLLAIAKDRVSLPEICRLISSAPQSVEELHTEEWKEQSFCYECVKEADAKEKTPSKERDFLLAARYWFSEIPSLAPETRSSIVSMFTSVADCFLRGILADMFCGGDRTRKKVIPELTHQGSIIILDLPVKEFGDLGQFSQVLFKFIWQKATERRDVRANPRPVFLWADEAQNFFTSYDMQFQATARSSRACTVYLTQNLPNYYAVMGGTDKGKPEADSLLGNLQTKIFHANGDSSTNQWAAELIGKNWQSKFNVNSGSTQNQFQPGISETSGVTSNQVLEYEVLPREFTILRKGGWENDQWVDSLIFQGGRIWQSTGKNVVYRPFSQVERAR